MDESVKDAQIMKIQFCVLSVAKDTRWGECTLCNDLTVRTY